MRTLILCLIALMLGAGLAAGQNADEQATAGRQYHIEASRNAIVRAGHHLEADVLMRMVRGDCLNLVTNEQTERYYHVFLPDGGMGWVSRYVVRLFDGPAADETVIVRDGGAADAGTASTAPAAADNFHLAVGRPLGYEVLENRGCVVGYNAQLKIPAWVQYRLTRDRSETEVLDRTNSFDEDGALPRAARATLADYAAVSSDYVRGHMAPADDMLWSVQAEAQCNLLSNIAPQIGTGYNGSVWLRIENRVRRWVLTREDLTIITGPVFESRPYLQAIDRQPETDRQMLYNVVGAGNVAVPTGYFKIIVDMRNLDAPDVLAFMVPHFETVAGPEREIEQYLRSVDDIEALTGLDFLSGLSTTAQEAVEGQPAQALW